MYVIYLMTDNACILIMMQVVSYYTFNFNVFRSDCNDGPALFVSAVCTYEDEKARRRHSIRYQDCACKFLFGLTLDI